MLQSKYEIVLKSFEASPDSDTSVIDMKTLRVSQKERNVFKINGKIEVKQNFGPTGKVFILNEAAIELQKGGGKIEYKWLDVHLLDQTGLQKEDAGRKLHDNVLDDEVAVRDDENANVQERCGGLQHAGPRSVPLSQGTITYNRWFRFC